MGWNKFAAAAYARHNARASSHGICATYVRMAIRAGGIELPITHFAKDYGPVLIHAGFRPLKPGETPQTGDIVVIQPSISPCSTAQRGTPISASATCGAAPVTGRQNRLM